MSSKQAQNYQPADSIFGYSRIIHALTQSSTSAPTAVVRVNETAATLTYARSGAGVYTITASSAIFTVGKVDVIIPKTGNALHVFKVDFTSNTVITLTTALLTNIIADITAVPTDGILGGQSIEIRIHD